MKKNMKTYATFVLIVVWRRCCLRLQRLRNRRRAAQRARP
jgi:hypothetical protein